MVATGGVGLANFNRNGDIPRLAAGYYTAKGDKLVQP